MVGSPCKNHSPAAVASRRCCCVCAVVSLATLLVVTVAIAVVALTTLRLRAMAATLEGLCLASLSLSARPRTPSLSATFDANLTIRNPSALATFTDADLLPGRIVAGGIEDVTVRLTLLADHLAAHALQLYGDLVSTEDVPLTVRTVVPGKVMVFGVLRHRVVVTTVCDVVVSTRSLGTETSSCRYRTKL